MKEAIQKVVAKFDDSKNICWNEFYNNICELLGNDFDSKMPFYENVDEIMFDLGFMFNEDKNEYRKVANK